MYDKIADYLINAEPALALRVADCETSGSDVNLIAGTLGSHELDAVDAICAAIRRAFGER